MASARGRTILLLFLATTLLCAAAAAAAAFSWEDDRGGRRPSLRQCVRRCEEERPRYQRARCVQECREQQQEQGRHDDDDDELGRSRGRGGDWRGEGSGDEQQEGRRRPYVFGRRSFRRVVRSEQGSLWALRRFDEASKLLRGIRDYRVAVLEANPRSFLVPSHTDTHAICYVAQGEGVVTTIENGERRSYTIREGHIFVAPAGAVTYLANTDGRRKLVIAKLLRTISVPGEVEFFFPGGRNPESFLSAFSKSVQRAAYKTSSDRLEKLFGGQDKGVIVRASEEQIRELRRQASEGGHGPHWPLPPFGESSRGPHHLLDQRPSVANRHGQLYEADARSFRDLADHDVRVSLVNITAGSMTAPFYNTRSIKIAYVLDGEGHVEIVCPHLAHGGESEHGGRRGGRSERGEGRRRGQETEEEEQEGSSEEEQEEAGQGYKTIRARLTRGTAFVEPVGHPVVAVASRGSNLQIVCFEVNAEGNERVYLAGARNVLRKLDGTAKELAFAASAREVDEVLDSQREEAFLPGPEQSGGQEREEEEGRHGRGRREQVAETFLRLATGRL
ncbi:hypothetical protein ACP70R_024747 [Stipagrostis hirtigluma subsp. patula]